MTTTLRPAPRRRAARPLALAASALLTLALAACGGDKASGGNVDPASLMPASASAYLGVSVRPQGESKEDVERLSRVIFGSDSPGQAILDIAGKASGRSALTFGKEVEPWIGDQAGGALLPFDGGENEIVLVAASRDDDAARKAIEGSGKLPETATFREVDYRKSADGRLAGAVFEGAVVLGSERAVQLVVSSVREDSVLSGAARYATALEELPKDGVATVYLDVGAIAELVGGLLGGGVTAQLLEPVISAQGDAIAATVFPQDDSLRIEAVGTGTGSGIAAVQARGGASEAIETVPADAWLALGISDVGDTLATLIEAASSAGGLQAVGVSVLVGQIESSLGLKFQADILDWMGPGALFVRGTAEGRVGGALVVKSKNPAKTRRAVRALRAAGGGLPSGAVARSLGAEGIDEGALLTLGSLKLEVAAAGDRFVIALGPGALEAALDPAGELGDAEAFRAAERRLGDGLRAGLLLDLPQLGDLLARSGDGPGGKLLSDVLQRMTLLVAGGTQDGDVSRVRLNAGVAAG